MTLMTEEKAWRRLADKFVQMGNIRESYSPSKFYLAIESDQIDYENGFGLPYFYGICHGIGCIGLGFKNAAIQRSMMTRIELYMDKNGKSDYEFLFPCDYYGLLQRRLLCLQFADQCKEEKEKRNEANLSCNVDRL